MYETHSKRSRKGYYFIIYGHILLFLVCPKRAIGTHEEEQALGIFREIANTSFKRLSLEKPKFLGQEIRKLRKTQKTDHLPMSWKVCRLQERNVLAGLVLEIVTCTTDSKDGWRHISKRGWKKGRVLLVSLQNHFAFGSRPRGSVGRKDISIKMCAALQDGGEPAGCFGRGRGWGEH